jgi:hypothetical protein
MFNFVDESSKARLAYAILARNSIFMLLWFVLSGIISLIETPWPGEESMLTWPPT